MNGNITQDISPHRIGIAQSRASRNILAFRERILQSFGLTSPEWFVLGYVASETKAGGTRVGDIAVALDVQSTYITGTLRKLEAKRLVQTKADHQDRRARIVTATKKGMTAAEEIDTIFIQQGRVWLGNVPISKIQSYLTILEILAKGLPQNPR